jgi:hypothetical protein
VGGVAGGVYTTEVFGEVFEGLRVPQAGVQPALPWDIVQVTPEFPEAPVTMAVSVMGAAPASTTLNVPCTFTVTPEPEEFDEPHAQHQAKANKQTNAANGRVMESFFNVARDFSGVA